MMEKILQDHGYQVRSFTSPLKAIEEFKKSLDKDDLEMLLKFFADIDRGKRDEFV